MKKIILLSLIIFAGISFSQPENQFRKSENQVKYYQDFMAFKGDKDKARLDVFIQVPYNAVQFVKTGQGFEAQYSLTVSVFDEDKTNLITEKIWNEKITAISFELTTSPDNFNLSHRFFDLSAGTY